MIKAEKLKGNDGRYWIRASFDRNQRITDEISQIEGGLYDTMRDIWAIPYEKRPEFQERLSQFLIDWVDEPVPYNGGIDEKTFSKYPEVDGYSVEYDDEGNIIDFTGFKKAPWADFQVRGFNAIATTKRLILADEMGLGKTFQVVTGTEALIRQDKVNKVLVLAKASLLYMWRDEIHKFTNKKAVVFAGNAKQRSKIRDGLIEDPDSWDYVIMSYEMYRGNSHTVSEIDDYVRLNCVIMDEAHKIKNPLSKIGERVGWISFDHVYLLTATPLPNNPLESFNYLRLCKDMPERVEGSYTSQQYYNFREHYGQFGGFQGREIIGYKNMNELREHIQRNMLRRTKQEKLPDLPAVAFNNIHLELNAEQRKYYNAITEGILEDLSDTDIYKVPSILAQLTRLQQVVNSPALIGVEGAKKSVKEKALADLIEDIVDEGGGKVIIFTRFREYLDMILEDYSHYNPAVVHGEVSSHAPPSDVARERAKRQYGQDVWDTFSKNKQDSIVRDLSTSPRQKAVDRFQNDHRCKIFLGTTEACKEGLTLTAASNVIFLDYPWNWASYSQAFSRAHRIGQENAVTVHNLICEDTVDVKVFNTIIEKKSLTELLIDTKVGNDEIGGHMARDFILGMI